MSGLNPLAGAILQSIQVQRQAGAEKQQQARREQVLSTNIAAADDRFEHQVEGAEEVDEVNDEEQPHDQPGSKQNSPKKQTPPEESHVDLTA